MRKPPARDIPCSCWAAIPARPEKAGEILQTLHPDLRLAGTYCPEFGFEKRPEIVEEMKQSLRDASPDIIFVALGSPKQERVIADYRNVAPDAWWLGVGISFSFLCGEVRRAPKWMQKVGLEWSTASARSRRGSRSATSARTSPAESG